MKANLFFLITTVLWGLNYHFTKFLVAETSPFEAALWRYGLASLTMFIFTFNHLPKWKDIKTNFTGLFLVGFVGLFVFNYLFFLGMVETSPINALLIIGLNPAFTLLLSALILKTEINLRQVVGILIALVGILYLLFKGDVTAILYLHFSHGDALIIAACIFFALHHVFVKKYSANMDSTNFSFLCAVVCFIPLLFINITANDYGNLSEYTSRFWLSAIGIGCFGTGISYYLWYKGIEMTSAPKAAIFMNVVPLSGAIFSWALGDPMYIYHAISAFLVVFGIMVMQLKMPARFTARKSV